ESPARQRPQEALRAWGFLRSGRRPADEDALTRRCVSRTFGVVRSTDSHGADCECRPDAAHARTQNLFVPHFVSFEERHADESRSRLYRDPDLERSPAAAAITRIGVVIHL